MKSRCEPEPNVKEKAFPFGGKGEGGGEERDDGMRGKMTFDNTKLA